MSAIAPALAALSRQIAELTGRLGQPVDALSLGVTDRAGHLTLGAPGRRSANRACRLVRAADGWIAVNLAREEDRELTPAWLEGRMGAEPWAAVERHARTRTRADLLARADLLGLPVGGVGEVAGEGLEAPRLPRAAGAVRRGPLKVVDLSALWAGPMCGAILAAMGASVIKVESTRRPDPTRTATPEFFRRLNGAKADLALDLTTPEGHVRLGALIAAADVLITGVRPRGLASLGLTEAGVFAANPGLVWVAVTGYGWTGPAASRVAFGDDAAAAGGLVRWTPGGEPRFLGDALADPVTGLAAAAGALTALDARGGVVVDAALARCAAGAAQVCGFA